MSKFTEAKLEQAIIELLSHEGIPHVHGGTIARPAHEVLLKDDLRAFLSAQYGSVEHAVGDMDAPLTAHEIESIIRQLESYPVADLYASNKAIMKLVSDGFLLKREDRTQKDRYIQLIDYDGLAELKPPTPNQVETIVAETSGPYRTNRGRNIVKLVNQLEIEGHHKRIPDGILYINGLPLVVFEFKSAIRESATIYNAHRQLTVRYKRDIPELFKYNALCVISDGANNKMGSFFAAYNFFYAWRKIDDTTQVEPDGIDSLYTMIHGLFNHQRLRQVIRHFIYFPDKSHTEEKIICRYPQFYAALSLFHNIKQHRKPDGDGKGGTYFGATGSGKSYIMLFLSRLLMKSLDFESPTIILITDRTDLDDQLSAQFTNAKRYIGDDTVVSVESRAHLRQQIKGRTSGGVFLTTIHKFTEDTDLLTERSNVICISDEAHRSQINLDQKVRITKDGVKRSYGFAKYLHDSLPNATYVGISGTPIDGTLDVFGPVVSAYTMTESVKDEITVRIVYEGRAAKVLLDNRKLQEIEAYYQQCAEDGSSTYQIEKSKTANSHINAILGDPDRLHAVATDFVQHYQNRVDEGATLKGKAMIVCSSRAIAYDFYKAVIALRPNWAEVKAGAPEFDSPPEPAEGGGASTSSTHALSEQERKEIKPMARIKMIMTRNQDDDKALYDMLGNKAHRKMLDRQFKDDKSNFKIAIVVDMWLTGFDVPSLDTIYIDKPIRRHNLIQTISRVNRRVTGKEKGLVVDYIGIKRQMNMALAHYNKTDGQNIEEIEQSIVVVKDHLDLLGKIFHKFDSTLYFHGTPVEQLHCLNMAVEFVQITQELEKRFMHLVKRLKAAYDICSGSETFSQAERDLIHFYLAVRSIIFKLTRGTAPDIAQMNARVREMVAAALQSDGVAEIFKLDEGQGTEIDLFDEDYLAKLDKIKLPNTKIKLLQRLLAKAIDEFKKTNRAKGIDFSKRFKSLVDKYNERQEHDTLSSEVLEDFTDEIIDLYHAMRKERESFVDLGISFEEKAFYDILKRLTYKYDFSYPEEKLLILAQAVKAVVDDKAKYTDWNQREDIKAELKVNLIILLAEHGYPPVDRDEVYHDIFEQAENFKKHRAG